VLARHKKIYGLEDFVVDNLCTVWLRQKGATDDTVE